MRKLAAFLWALAACPDLWMLLAATQHLFNSQHCDTIVEQVKDKNMTMATFKHADSC